MSGAQKNTDSESWAAKLQKETYDIPDDVEVTKENCREFIDYWVRLYSATPACDPNDSCRPGRQLHVPDPRKKPPDVEPLCHARDGEGNWKRKDLAAFPPPWDQDMLCKRCLFILRGEDYVDARVDS